MRIKTLLVLVTALLGACAPRLAPSPVTVPVEKRAPAEFPEDFYQRASEQGAAVFRIEPERSEAIVYVYRGGSLERLGHDHVMVSREVLGYILLNYTPVEVRADLYVPLDSLVVDEPGLRTEAGFVALPEDFDYASTRRNMLEKVLEAERYPFALIHVDTVERDEAGLVLSATMTLHGVARALRIPVEIAFDETTLNVSGRFSLQQTNFDITPFSALGGAWQVQDGIDLRFRIHAKKVAAPR